MTSTAIVARADSPLTAAGPQVEQEIAGYQQFAEALRSVRRCVARNELPEAQERCRRVVDLAEGLQRMAQARNAEQLPGLTETDPTGRLPAQMLWLRDAQFRAQRELAVTLAVLTDLHDHTAAVLSALQGQRATTYDHTGRRA